MLTFGFLWFLLHFSSSDSLPPTWRCPLALKRSGQKSRNFSGRPERRGPDGVVVSWTDQEKKRGWFGPELNEKIKIAAGSLPPPPLYPPAQFTAVKTYLKVGVDSPPAERWLSHTGLLWPSSHHDRTDNFWISVTFSYWSYYTCGIFNKRRQKKPQSCQHFQWYIST